MQAASQAVSPAASHPSGTRTAAGWTAYPLSSSTLVSLNRLRRTQR